jgi:hypothetical protein
MSGNAFADSLIRTNEEWYLFSKENNIKEYKNRLSAVLTTVRAIIKNVNASATLQGIIGATTSISGY